MRNRRKNKSIQKKILVSFSSILAASFLVIGMIVSYLVLKNARETELAHSEQILSLISENMNQTIENVNNISKQIILNEKTTEYCVNSDQMSEYQRLKSEIDLGHEMASDILHSNQFICSLVFYPKEGYCVSFGEIQYMSTDEYNDWFVYKTGIAKNEPAWFAAREVQAPYGKKKVISYTRPVCTEGGEAEGLVEIQISAETISASLESLDITAESGVLLLDDNGESVLPGGGELGDSSEFLESVQKLKKKNQNVQISANNESYILNYVVLQNDWILVYYQSMKNLTSTATTVVRIIVIAGVLMLFLMILLSRRISYQLIQPIKKVIDVTRDMDETVEFDGSEDEVTALLDNYNMMMCRIRESELDTLRAQITPHFLYNTLNSIKFRALLDGNEAVAKMTQWLINLLELSINNRNEYVTLTEEVNMLQSYVGLQKERSDKEFVFSVEIYPEEVSSCLIPKMILQTLVENAILHGIEEKEYNSDETGAEICVRASLSGNDLKIEVTDNGVGMSQERISEIMQDHQREEKRKLNRVGLFNVDQRIKLYFGKSYGLSIKSEQGRGTTVTLIMPCAENPEIFRKRF